MDSVLMVRELREVKEFNGEPLITEKPCIVGTESVPLVISNICYKENHVYNIDYMVMYEEKVDLLKEVFISSQI